MQKIRLTVFCLGFTLIELLIVISVIGLLSGIGLTAYINFSRSQLVTQTAQKIAQDLRLAQSLASNNQKPQNCTSTLDSYTFSINQTSKSYSIGANCGASIEIKSSSIPSVLQLEGATSVKFRVLRQGVETIGGTTITVKGFNKSKTIVISGEAISVQGE